MSSLAQDELGHAQALYGLLAEVTGARRRRHPRLRPRARRVPPRAPARPRPRRLGDDDRPALPVRDGRRGAAGRPGVELLDAARRAGRQARARGAVPPDARRGVAGPAGHGRGRAARPACSRRSTTLGPDAGTVFTPLPGEPALVDAGILARPMAELEREWRAELAPTFDRLGLPAPPATSDPARGRTDHGERLRAGCTASSPRSAEATRERRGERSRDARRHRPGARRGRSRRATVPTTRERPRRPRRGPRPRAAGPLRRRPRHRPSRRGRCRRASGSRILPTFVGCPALDVIRGSIADRLGAFGLPGPGRHDLRGALDVGAHLAGRPPRARGRGDRPARRSRGRPLPVLRVGQRRHGQRVRADPVPLAVLLPRRAASRSRRSRPSRVARDP